MKQYLFLFFAFVIANLSAQPGGGGGLYIKNVFDADYRKLNDGKTLIDDLEIRTFLMEGNSVLVERFESRIQGRAFRSGFSISMPHPSFYERNSSNSSNQRLLMIYKGDTMLIDFVNIEGENGMGNVDHMDSLFFRKGCFKYDRGIIKQNKSTTDLELKKLIGYKSRGFTPSLFPILKEAEIIREIQRFDFSFLSEEKLPAKFFKERARYFFEIKDSIQAKENLQIVVKKTITRKDCDSKLLLVDTYILLNEIKCAIDVLNDAMNCKRDYWDQYSNEYNFRLRAELYTKIGDYEKAQKDYNRLQLAAENPLAANIERAIFKIRYMNDAKSAVLDLKNVIDTISEEHFKSRLHGWSEFSETYYYLGYAYYKNKDYDLSFKTFLKAMQLSFGNNNGSDQAIANFDSLIIQFPKNPELYLSRAIAYYQKGPYQGWGEETKKSFEQALKDIDMAEKNGMKDIRINYQRSWIMSQAKKHKEALAEAEIAISKDKNDPRGYAAKYEARRGLGLVAWGNREDEDFKLYQEKLKTYFFER